MKIEKVLILGAGTMGAGIAQWFSQQGVKAHLFDNKSEVSTHALEKIHASWKKLIEKNKFSSTDVENFKSHLDTLNFSEIDGDYDLVIEAIVENIEVKVEVSKNLEKILSQDCLLASNTSSIPISSMAKELSPSTRERFMGIHFFNPAPIMKLVELIQGHATDLKILKDLSSWFEQRGKKTALCQDSPGFIVNRVARNFYGESLRVLESEDKKSAKEIDQTLKEVCGFRMGPFELMDLIGIDVNYDVTQSVWKKFFNEPRFAPHALQRKMVESGRYGRKTKEGFYKYE